MLQRLEAEGRPVWADGDALTFVYEGKAERVEVCCGLQEPLTRLPNSDVWVLSKTIPNLSQAVISYFFIVDGTFPQTEGDVWRGYDAPRAPERLEGLKGRVFERTLHSETLDEFRTLTVYLPPNYDALNLPALPVVYLADGGVVRDYAPVVEPLIAQGELPPLLLIGVASGAYAGDPEADYDPELDLRAREYIPDRDDERFSQHERFFIEEVLPWAEETFGAPREREQRAVYGHSNGGVFAAAMGLRHPEVFGYALSFSVGVDPTEAFEAESETGTFDFGPVNTKFYFVAGELEEGFFKTTQGLAEKLADGGVESRFEGRVAGHDSVLWREAFPGALEWAFGRQP